MTSAGKSNHTLSRYSPHCTCRERLLIPRASYSLFSLITAAAFILPAAYAFLYGIRSAHRLYSLANLSFGWLAFSTTESYLDLQRRLPGKLSATFLSESPTLAKRRLSEPPRVNGTLAESGPTPKPAAAGSADGGGKG